ncbi:MAG: FixH family protein [Halioglobus sp.]
MNKHLPREDSEPWYRQFWPWFLILLPASVVVAGISTVIIANWGADDLVVDEYYKDGLAINRKLEKKEQATALGISADIRVSGTDIVVLTSGDIEAAQLLLQLSHPLESDRDFNVILIQSTPGEYRGRLASEIAPRWHWALIFEGDPAWRLDGSVTLADFPASGG